MTNHVELEGLESISAEIMQEAQAAPPQAKVAFTIAAGIVLLGELIINEIKHPTPTMPPVPGGLGIPGYDPFRQTYTPPGSPSTQTKPKPTILQVQQKKGPKDLVGEAIEQKLKETEAAERLAKRKAQTKRGSTRIGNSNQGTRGSHSGGNDSETHDAAEARRAKEQAAADAKKAAEKKKQAANN